VVQDADSEFIGQALATPGNIADAAVLPQLVQPQAQELMSALGVAPALHSRYPRPGRPRKSWRERPKIQRKFAESKKFHGLRQARYWELVNVAIQTFMVALVVNLKRWVTLLKLRSPAFS
jgi:IS5 family transposase